MHKKSHFKGQRSNQAGSMLILVCVVMALLALGMVIAFSFAGLFFAHNRLQTSADEIALAGARRLNEFNRLGQMNDMIARSRQLVFSTRKQYDDVIARGNSPLAEKFARLLMEEARAGADQLEKERRQLTGVVITEAEQAMRMKFDQIKGSYAMVLPWLTVETPQRVSIVTGTIAGMQSSAQELEGFDELVQKDRWSKNTYPAKPVNLYSAENDARLPTIDSSLHFRFSPLAAPVVNDMAPARMVLQEKFQKSVEDYAPCATRVELALKVATGLGPHGGGTFKVASAATATGGGLWQ